MILTINEINLLLSTLDIQIEGFETMFCQQYENGEEIDKDDVNYYKSLRKLRKKFDKSKVFINKEVKHGKR